LEEPAETRSPHRRYFGDLLYCVGITLAARATLDARYMSQFASRFKNFLRFEEKFFVNKS
jgi:hypothetical protein